MKRVIALLCLAAALAGCGITAGPVIEQGRPDANDEQEIQNYSERLAKPDSVTSATELVARFLVAPADRPENIDITLSTYMVDNAWTPRKGREISVVRVLGIEEGGVEQDTTPVHVRLQKIGVLRDGQIVPAPEPERTEVFKAVNKGPNGYQLQGVPAELMLWDKALSEQFQLRPIYLWDKQLKRLIPDYRYLPKYLNPVQQARQLIDWLYGGLPSWMQGYVAPPPAQVRPTSDPIFKQDGVLVIDLPTPLPAPERDLFATQLENTLVAGGVTGMRLQVQGQQVNPSKIQLPAEAPPKRYGIRDGRVVRLAATAERRDEGLPPAVVALDGVSWVEFSRREAAVAVRQNNRLLVGLTSGTNLIPVDLAAQQAAWLDAESNAALVLATDGKLYEVTVAGQVNPLPVNISGPAAVSSFSVMPDGRIALVINGQLMMALLWRNENGGLFMTHPQQVPTNLATIKQVAFSKRGQLYIAGTDGAGQALVMTVISLDGSQQESAWSTYGGTQAIFRLATDRQSGNTYYTYLGAAYQLQLGSDEKVALDQASRPLPTASASPGTGTVPADKPIESVSFEG